MSSNERNADALESDIEQTRARIDNTISALEHKLSPGQLLDEGIDYLKRSGGGEFTANLRDSVTQNPLPVALMGLGVGWLMFASRSGNGSAGRPRMRERMSGAAESAGEAAERIGDKAAHARDRARDIAGEARAGMHRMRGSARSLTRGAVYNARRATSRMTDYMYEQPLVLGALGIAFGAALGASLPATEQEDELLGPMRDDLVQRTAETGREQAEKVKSAAYAAKDAAQREADQQGLTTPH